jgi:hypothetical protein
VSGWAGISLASTTRSGTRRRASPSTGLASASSGQSSISTSRMVSFPSVKVPSATRCFVTLKLTIRSTSAVPGMDVPLRFDFGSLGGAYRCQLYVNGWQVCSFPFLRSPTEGYRMSI